MIEYRREEGWLIVRWRGEVDMANAPLLELATLDALSNSDVGMTIDLTEASYIDSAGIRSLITLRRLLVNRQIELSMVVPEDSLLNRALEIGGVFSLIPVRRSFNG